VVADEFSSVLSSNTIQVPMCPVCAKPVPFLHRFKKEMAAKKKQIMKVVDLFFALKSGVSKLKKELMDDLGEGKKRN
jgi:hypothetical protein